MADCMKNASEALHQLLVEGLGRLVAEGKIPAEPIPAFRVEVPADKSHGDFAANVAMVSAKTFGWHLGKSPNCCWMQFPWTARSLTVQKSQDRDS